MAFTTLLQQDSVEVTSDSGLSITYSLADLSGRIHTIRFDRIIGDIKLGADEAALFIVDTWTAACEFALRNNLIVAGAPTVEQ